MKLDKTSKKKVQFKGFFFNLFVDSPADGARGLLVTQGGQSTISCSKVSNKKSWAIALGDVFFRTKSHIGSGKGGVRVLNFLNFVSKSYSLP